MPLLPPLIATPVKEANVGQGSPCPSLHAAAAAVQPRLWVLYVSTQVVVSEKQGGNAQLASEGGQQWQEDAPGRSMVAKALCRLP